MFGLCKNDMICDYIAWGLIAVVILCLVCNCCCCCDDGCSPIDTFGDNCGGRIDNCDCGCGR